MGSDTTLRVLLDVTVCGVVLRESEKTLDIVTDYKSLSAGLESGIISSSIQCRTMYYSTR